MADPNVEKEDSYDMHAIPRKYKPPVPDDPTRVCKTRTVILKETGGEAVINAVDFDPGLHDVPGAKAAAGVTAKLEAMTLAELRDLAKASKVDLGEATKKADLVAILAAAGATV